MAKPLAVAPTPELLHALLTAPGTTAHSLLTDAEGFRAHAAEIEMDGNASDAAAWRFIAAEMEARAPDFPDPPKLPAGGAA